MKEATNNTAIVDVRTQEEFAGGHFPGAINILLEEVSKRINEFKKLPGTIITYCRSGNRSGMAVAILKQNGIANAVNGGGLDDMLQRNKKQIQ